MDFAGQLNAAIAALFSGGITAAIAKAYISKSLQDLETVLEKIAEIRTDLAKIGVRLERFDDAAELVVKHDRKIAAMEAKLYGNKRSSSGFNSASD